MRRGWMLAALLFVPVGLLGQGDRTPGLLRVTVTLPDASQTPTPVARHLLLISANPATAEPKRVTTRADGTIDVSLPPGSYIVESDRPVTFLGKAYQWTQVVSVVAGRDTALRLSADNADAVAFDAGAAAGTETPAYDPSFLFAKWQDSVVAVWSPTSRASGFVIDARGLIATDRSAVGDATSVAVQLSADVKMSGQVVFSSPANAAAIIWVHPDPVAGRPPLPLECPAPADAVLDDDDEVTTIAAPHNRPVDQTTGGVTAQAPRAVETDFRLAFGGAGGPVFNAAGALVGLTSTVLDTEANGRGPIGVVRAGILCEAVSAARTKIAGASPPAATRLPIEPTGAFPADAPAAAPQNRVEPSAPRVISTSDFEVTFLTPPMVRHARERADWTGGNRTRTAEAEARLGRITDFGAWSPYFADAPPVLIVRVTPKLVEGFWKRLAREAARTQGAVLPAFTDFKTSFLRLQATCGSADVRPIHPFVLEHAARESDVVREGLYVFDPGAFGPHCGRVTLTVFADKAPAKGEAVTIEPAVIERLWQDFAPYRLVK